MVLRSAVTATSAACVFSAVTAGILRARRPAAFQALGRAVAPNPDKQLELDYITDSTFSRLP
jgi:hypothetical protein